MKHKLRQNQLRSASFLFVSLVICAAVNLFFPAVAGAQDDRSFHFPSVIIEAEVNPDGTMSVTEERTFRFDGRYRGAWAYIYLKHNAAIRDVLVSEGGEPYREMPVGTQDIPGIFYVEYESDQIYIDWSYEANNEDRTFTLSYVVDNAVLVHEDVAELYWQFIGDEWGERADYVRVTLTLPAGANHEDVRAWGHGPLTGEVFIESPTTIVWEVEDLPAWTILEGRVAFPLELVAQAKNYTGKDGLPGMLADEQKWANQANRRRTMARVDFFLGPLLFLVMLVFYIVAKIGEKRSPDAYKGDYYRELPGDYSPAEAGYLIRSGKTKPEDFTATVLDLSRRGHLKFEEYQGESGLIFKKPFTDYRVMPALGKDPRKKHEQLLHSFIFEKVAGRSEQGTTMRDIERFGKSNSESTALFYQSWTKSIKEETDQQKFYKGIAWPGIIIGIVMTLIGIPFFFLDMFVTGMITSITGPFLIVGFVLLKRLTPLGADHYAKWKAFKKFLKHFSRLDQSTIPSIAVWEHYLVYAVVMGVAKEVMEQLHLVYPELKNDTYLLGPTFGVMASNPTRFNSVASSMDRSFKTAFRSATSSGGGSGGGFSGGGGGGGGGGAR
ncbi:MAG: DUF2207 domain-containing protein [Dethiobacteria bacterium]|nr:DUF2207 domain-containing protein [Dethiobacteria bacterium]